MKLAYIGIVNNLVSILREIKKGEHEITVFDKVQGIPDLVNLTNPMMELAEYLLDSEVRIIFDSEFEAITPNGEKVDINCKNGITYVGYDKVVNG